MKSFVLLFFATATSMAAADTLKTWDPSPFSQEVTECDRLASHGEDPHSVAPGVRRADMDFDAAISACTAAVAGEPGNPRFHYQLARVYGYSGQGEKAYPHRAAAIEANYPQALFVNGYLHLLGINKAPKDVCRAGELIRRSAQYGRLAGQVGFPHYAMRGVFDGCDVRIDAAEMLIFLDAAKGATTGYYDGLLVEALTDQVKARWPKAPD